MLCRASADAGPSAPTGLATETIPEDEPEEDAAPTPEQLEVRILLMLCTLADNKAMQLWLHCIDSGCANSLCSMSLQHVVTVTNSKSLHCADPPEDSP